MSLEKGLRLGLLALILGTVLVTAVFLLSQWPDPATLGAVGHGGEQGGYCYSLLVKTIMPVDAATLQHPPAYLINCRAS